ncbi:MAG TPA: CRISPR-associated endoribonuclease Cas6 [bacterium]|nr:CRISPR-associated endoribonuclease Cas6 [bacterium]HPP29783.1 CRISPR-associated endoribonuclease Cas6 [bacterium]
MRIKIDFETINEKEIVLPIHYNYLIQSFIYKNIDKKLANFLHDKGFEFEKRKFKLFVFSRIFGEKIKFLKEEISLGKKIFFYLSSPLKEFISQFADNILKKYEFKIYKNTLVAKEISVISFPSEINEITKIKMLSPMTVYSTLCKGEKKKTYYYSPFEKEFEILLKENLRKKIISFYKKEINFDFKIKPDKVDKNCEKIIIYKGNVIKGWVGSYLVETDKKILNFAYDVGLGGKNSQGFGLFEICT